MRCGKEQFCYYYNTFQYISDITVLEHLPNTYLFKVVIGTLKKSCEICSKLTIKTPERRQCQHSVFLNVNSEHISHPFVVFLVLTLSK